MITRTWSLIYSSLRESKLQTQQTSTQERRMKLNTIKVLIRSRNHSLQSPNQLQFSINHHDNRTTEWLSKQALKHDGNSPNHKSGTP